jgi:hypothetical protein
MAPLHPSDRAWLLKRLPAAKAEALRHLLAEPRLSKLAGRGAELSSRLSLAKPAEASTDVVDPAVAVIAGMPQDWALLALASLPAVHRVRCLDALPGKLVAAAAAYTWPDADSMPLQLRQTISRWLEGEAAA